MSTAVVPFDFESHAIRSLVIDGAWWFVAADVCRVLELTQVTNALRSLDAHQVCKVDLNTLNSSKGIRRNTVGLTDGIGSNTVASSKGIQVGEAEKGVTNGYTLGSGRRGNPNASAVSEGGLYKLIFRSKLAVTPGTIQWRFANWVVDDLLPALRKYGSYSLINDRQQLGAKRAHYAALPGKVQDRAALRREAVEFINAAIANGARIGDATAEAAEKFGVSASSIHRWRSVTYMVADPDMEAALAPKWSHGPRGMMAACHPDAMARYLDLVGRRLRYATAYARIKQEADHHGWEPIPCAKTMMREAQRVLPRLGASRHAQIGTA